MVSFSDKELIANIVPPLQLVPQAFYAAATGILRRLQRHFVFRKPGSVWPSTAHFFVYVTEKYACGLASSCGISDV